MKKIGLVLEGGGFRGIFAEGFTAWLLEHNIEIPYVIGVSMGATNGANYISKQRGRNLAIVEEFIDDPRYLSKKNLVTKGSLFDLDFIFNDIAKGYNKFDFNTFMTSSQELVVGAMNCTTGQTTFVKKSQSDEAAMMDALRASISLPFISRIAMIDNHPHLDGGISDPIPVKQALSDGCEKVIVVSTREQDYVKTPFKGAAVGKLFYRQYPQITEALKARHLIYSETQDYITDLERQNIAMVIRPMHALPVGRTEKNLDKIRSVFNAGYAAAEAQAKMLRAFMDE